MTALQRLQIDIEPRLWRIEETLPPGYALTLLARKTDAGNRESDFLLTRDDLDEVFASIQHLKGNGS